jgi:hypothetical protein
LLIAIFTLCLFFLVGRLQGDGKNEAAETLAVFMRVLIVPMYLVWLAISAVVAALVGQGGLPGLVGAAVSLISFPAGFAPYVLADYVLDRWRRQQARPKDVF